MHFRGYRDKLEYDFKLDQTIDEQVFLKQLKTALNKGQKKSLKVDDSNVDRFANYLHKLTKNTQFIVITHRRGTMMAADRLYGITMQEKGVSTLVSVNLIEDSLTK